MNRTSASEARWNPWSAHPAETNAGGFFKVVLYRISGRLPQRGGDRVVVRRRASLS